MNTSVDNALCFPGFLGEKNDFSFLSMPFTTIEYFNSADKAFLERDLLSKDLNELPSALSDLCEAKSITSGIAIGYSFGARLLLQTVTVQPTLFNKIVIISGNPGLQFENERNNRLIHDENWAKRFLYDPWSELLKDWYLQPTLSSKYNPVRQECDFSRSALYLALTKWSLGKQDYLPHKISSLPYTLLWIVGENDEKFASIAKESAKIAKNIQLEIIPDAGHRVMWEKPSIVDTLIRTYVEQN